MALPEAAGSTAGERVAGTGLAHSRTHFLKCDFVRRCPRPRPRFSVSAATTLLQGTIPRPCTASSGLSPSAKLPKDILPPPAENHPHFI